MPALKGLHKNYIESRLAKQIKQLMAAEDVTQADLAEELGISQPAVNRKLKTGRLTAKELIIILQRTQADENAIQKIINL